jgi:hypothetical protein
LNRSRWLALLQGIRNLISPTPVTLRHPRARLWFALTLGYAAIAAALMGHALTRDPYALSDDARQHVFWMMRFVDADLFPQDWIADYYQSVSPVGYAWLYQGFAHLGISPFTLSKLLPAALMLVTAAVTFLACFELCALPAAGFAASVMLSQSVEYTVTLASGTSKAFVYGLMMVFLYSWWRRSWGLTWLSIALQGLLYPLTVLLTAGTLVLGLVERRDRRWRLCSDRSLWILTLGGLALAAGVILFYALSTSEFGPTMSRAIALTMPEFFRGGRTSYFQSDPLDYLLYGRSGLRLDTALTPVTNLLALALPLMLATPKRFPLGQTVRADIDILLKLALTSLFWFFAAHALLFKLYLPSRYTGRFLLMVLVLAGGIALVLGIDALLKGAIAALQSPATNRRPLAFARGLFAMGLALALALLLVLYPFTIQGYPLTSLTQGQAPLLYTYFAQQPKDTLIASLSAEASNLPSFAYRSVLASPEVAIPYHAGYYREISQRARATITAQYTLDPAVVKAFIAQYGVTHWLLTADAFEVRSLNRNRWVQQFQPEAGQAVSILSSRQVPVVQQISDRCTSFQTEHYRVLETACVLAAIE